MPNTTQKKRVVKQPEENSVDNTHNTEVLEALATLLKILVDAKLSGLARLFCLIILLCHLHTNEGT